MDAFNPVLLKLVVAPERIVAARVVPEGKDNEAGATPSAILVVVGLVKSDLRKMM